MASKQSLERGPLTGYRVIDVTQMLSGPMATMMLGDQGADVIKVEPPGIGDLTRAMGASKAGIPSAFAVINRNKRSIAIDLKTSRGVELV
ncbi:MAG TPA: CoA transferase, partial [Candidatus Binataceae bacterium]|nr:CoA transferase [Candidatus Binataceae bacterium]